VRLLPEEQREGGSPPSCPQPCFASQRLGRLARLFQVPPTKEVGELPTRFSILLRSSKGWLTCAIRKQEGKREGEGRAEGKGFLPPCFTVEEQVCLMAF